MLWFTAFELRRSFTHAANAFAATDRAARTRVLTAAVGAVLRLGAAAILVAVAIGRGTLGAGPIVSPNGRPLTMLASFVAVLMMIDGVRLGLTRLSLTRRAAGIDAHWIVIGVSDEWLAARDTAAALMRGLAFAWLPVLIAPPSAAFDSPAARLSLMLLAASMVMMGHAASLRRLSVSAPVRVMGGSIICAWAAVLGGGILVSFGRVPPSSKWQWVFRTDAWAMASRAHSPALGWAALAIATFMLHRAFIAARLDARWTGM